MAGQHGVGLHFAEAGSIVGLDRVLLRIDDMGLQRGENFGPVDRRGDGAQAAPDLQVEGSLGNTQLYTVEIRRGFDCLAGSQLARCAELTADDVHVAVILTDLIHGVGDGLPVTDGGINVTEHEGDGSGVVVLEQLAQEHIAEQHEFHLAGLDLGEVLGFGTKGCAAVGLNDDISVRGFAQEFAEALDGLLFNSARRGVECCGDRVLRGRGISRAADCGQGNNHREDQGKC